jgi:hypothetical protein
MKCAYLKDWTAQQVFDHVCSALLKQGRQSHGLIGTGDESETGCKYRGPGEHKCEAGHLIPDNEYDPSFETLSWWALIVGRDVCDAHNLLIAELQLIHDRHTPDTWRQRMRDVASDYDLSTSVLDS